MFSHRLDSNIPKKTYFDWLLLAFLAGSINVGGFMACSQFVSHITGFATLTGSSLSQGNFWEALGMLTIPLYFLGGVIVSAYLTEMGFGRIKGKQSYAPVMGVSSLMMLLVALLGHEGYFGEFGVPTQLQHDYMLLALLCGACGLQNAAITSASGSTIRTTHLTGITTDLGIDFIKIWKTSLKPKERRLERVAMFFRLNTILSFTLGSCIGALVFSIFHYDGFLFPSAIAAYAWYSSQNQAMSTSDSTR